MILFMAMLAIAKKGEDEVAFSEIKKFKKRPASKRKI